MLDSVKNRFGWIEACLRWAGRFGVQEKKAYRAVFGITDSMVSRDQAAFVRLFNDKLRAEVVEKDHGKLRFADPRLAPAAACFPEPDLLRWLEEVLGRSGFVDVPPIHRAPPRPEVLQPVIRGILGRDPLQFRYRSRRGEDTLRTVSPHVVVHVANRLHLRGWDHDRNAARDFLLTRMREVRPATEPSVIMEVDDEDMQEVRPTKGTVAFVAQDVDRDWQEEVELEITLREGEDSEAVREDFSLNACGSRWRRVRRAFVQYLVDQGDPTMQVSLRSPVIVRQISRAGTGR
jgi:hypothetical protein